MHHNSLPPFSNILQSIPLTLAAASEATNLGAAPTLLKQEYPHYPPPSLVILQWIPFVQPVINFVGIEISDSEEIVETATVTSALLRGKVVKARQKIFLKIYD